MLKNLSFDFKVLISSNRFLVVLTTVIVGAFVLPFSLYSNASSLYVGNAYDAFWFYNTNTRTLMFTFQIVVSLFAVLGNATIFLEESQFLSQLFSRTCRRDYYVSKFISTFISGFIIIFIFLALNYLNTWLILGAKDLSFTRNFYIFNINSAQTIKSVFTFPYLWSYVPHLNIMIYILSISILGGSISIATFGLSHLVRNKIVVYLGATLFSILSATILNLFITPISLWYWINVFDPQPMTRFDTPASINAYLMVMWVLILIIFGYWCIKASQKNDMV